MAAEREIGKGADGDQTNQTDRFREFTWQSQPHPPCLLPQTSTSFTYAPALQNDMDFSQLNAAEQAQMSRILEKKQVRPSG